MALMLIATTLPAIAASPGNSIVYFPDGNGVTYSCTGGPPFVVDPMSSEGNCSVEQIGGLPAGLVCDVPTALTFVHDAHEAKLEGKLCQ